MERTAPAIHAAKTIETKRPSRAISAGFRKIPVPTMVPTTMAVEAQGPRPRTSSRRFSVMDGNESECSVSGNGDMSGRGLGCGDDTADKRADGKGDARADEDIPGEGDQGETIDG